MRQNILAILGVLWISSAHAQFADQKQFARTTGGSANAQTVAIPNYANNVGVVIRFIPAFTNTGPTQLNINGQGLINVLASNGTTLANLGAGQLVAGVVAQVIYDGTQYQLLGGAPSSSGGGATANLNAIQIRLGPPAIIAGPTSIVGDTWPTFTVNNSGGFYETGANQLAWANCVSSLTQFINTGVAGAVNSCTGTPASNTQTVFTNTGNGTNRSVTSSFSIGVPAGSITPIAPAVNSDACGNWPQTAYKVGSLWYLYVHNEGPCDYNDPLGTTTFIVTTSAAIGASSFGVQVTPPLSAGMTPYWNGGGGLTGAIQTIAPATVATLTCTANATVTLSACTGSLSLAYAGMYVNGTNLPANDVISAVNAGAGTITLANAATGSGTNPVTVGSETVTMTTPLVAALTQGQSLVFNNLGFDNISQSMWTSPTGAPNSWSPMAVGGTSPGTIISSKEPPELGWLTGFSDGSMIPDETGTWMYAYAAFYCDSAVCDYKDAVFRAPIGNLGPGNWLALFNGCFCAPALNNPWNATTKLPQADLANWYGPAVAGMPGTPYKAFAVDGKGHSFNNASGETILGLTLSVSTDYTSFTHLHSPILNYDFQNFSPRGVDDLYLYGVLRSDTDGGPVLAPTHFSLWATWVPPNNSLNNRYTVEWPATMSVMSDSQIASGVPQIAVMLGLWGNTSTGQPYSNFERATTVEPYGSDQTDGAIESGWGGLSSLGFLPTSCPGSATINNCDATGAAIANRLEECLSNTSDDHQIHIDTNGAAGSCPSGWTHVRTVGWSYKAAPTFASNPLYSCLHASPTYHYVSNDPTCGGQTVVGPLGYALAN